ncbi:MAG: radical SAM protein [Clostridia bacterium]|nr:radical SAM protein [Clostridia bacterium]
MNDLLAMYRNGNYTVKLYSDGTKVKTTKYDEFDASFPDSMDLKITDYCDMNCPMCHEKSSINGKEGNLNEDFLFTLKSGTELAIGGGNPLSHSELIPFLTRMKEQGVICNLTVNEAHLKKDRKLIDELISKKLIFGLGVSIKAYNQYVIDFAKSYRNTVLHVINGIFEDYDKITDQELKVLILGYKMFGKGKTYYNDDVKKIKTHTKNILPSLLDKFDCISFDNLALEQLDVKSIISPEEYENMYMGDDGEATMYIDLVNREYAKSSTSTERFTLENDIIPMFRKIKNNRY